MRQELEKHLALLQRQGMIEGWHAQLAVVGEPWAQQVEQALNRAVLILLLISADFLASDACYEQQMERALERQKRGEVQVLPILVRPVYWQDAPFAILPMVPTNRQAVTMWSDKDAAWTHITEGIRCVLEGNPLPLIVEAEQEATYRIKNEQMVQGQVIGDHPIVHQHFYSPTSSSPIPIASQMEQRWMMSDVQQISALASHGPVSISDFHSCFISYSSKDQEFVERLSTDLRDEGVQCWVAQHDMKIGNKIRSSIDESIRAHDKLLLILSMSSVVSQWVETEVEFVFEQEQQQNKLILFPIRIDEAVIQTTESWAANIRRIRHIGNFTRWREQNSYRKAFTSLLRDLKVEPSSGERAIEDAQNSRTNQDTQRVGQERVQWKRSVRWFVVSISLVLCVIIGGIIGWATITTRISTGNVHATAIASTAIVVAVHQQGVDLHCDGRYGLQSGMGPTLDQIGLIDTYCDSMKEMANPLQNSNKEEDARSRTLMVLPHLEVVLQKRKLIC